MGQRRVSMIADNHRGAFDSSMADYLLALDQGTTSSRALVFDSSGAILAHASQQLHRIYPQSGWVEHDPMEIWSSQRCVAEQAIQQAGVNTRDIRGIGITN
jgi:glycerol kinase